jgi:hypothetical protein
MRPPITPSWERLWLWLFPLTPPDRSDQRKNHDLRAFALGLSRSGTDSLRSALTILGYQNVYHGYVVPMSQPSDGVLWCSLMQRKYAGDFTAVHMSAEELRREFDKVIGNCQALTDVPCAVFAEELIKAYPGAKVIINRRELSVWFESMQKTAMAPFAWPLFVLHFFDAEFFWVYRTFELSLMVWYKGEFDTRGKEIATAHYVNLERVCKEGQREHLNWTAEDGWRPLCDYLDREMPQEDFPWENKGGSAFEKKLEKSLGVMVPRAMRNLGIFVAGIVAMAGAVWWCR